MQDSPATQQPRNKHWLQQLADFHQNKNIVQFLLYGNINDEVKNSQATGAAYLPLQQFLQQVVLAPKDHVITLRTGDRPGFNRPESEQAFRQTVLAFDQRNKTNFAEAFPEEPVKQLAIIEEFARARLLDNESVGVVVTADEGYFGGMDNLVYREALVELLMDFSRQKLYVQGDFIFLLLVPELTRVPPALAKSSYTVNLEIGLPNQQEREAFLNSPDVPLAQLPEGSLSAEALAKHAVGLQLRELHELVTMAIEHGKPLQADQLQLRKRQLRSAREGGILTRLEPESIPPWVDKFARMHATRTITQFILHGNIVDYVRHDSTEQRQYPKLRDYLMEVLFGEYDVVLTYDRATGIGFRSKANEEDFFVRYFFEGVFNKDRQAYEEWLKKLKHVEFAFATLERYFEDRLKQGKKVMFLVEYAETLLPMSGTGNASFQDRNLLVFFLKWAKESQFQQAGMTTILLADNLNTLNQAVVRNPFSVDIELPYPDTAERLTFIQDFAARYESLQDHLEMSPAVLARDTAGLTLVQLQTLLAEIVENAARFTYEALNTRKKDIIESEASGLLEFVETAYDLSAVAGHAAAKEHLREAAAALKANRGDVLPMGYLVNGPVGTGKTFLVSCFAAEIGIPMVQLKNFRSQYVGMTEANLEKVLRLLKAMNPVAVMIDEADAYLGNRNQGGDSGVGSRVFSMIASFMSNTAHRGKIIWFLLTARPDLMPVDLKRQGRAEEHIALFYPETLEEKQELLAVMLKKTGITDVDIEDFPADFFQTLEIRSGADMEAALTRAKFRTVAAGAEKVSYEIIKETFQDFIPPTYPEEVELMNYVAVLECTSQELLPPQYRKLSREAILNKVEELKARIPR